MKRLCAVLFLVFSWSTTVADLAGECQRPQRPTIPDGDAATKSELLDAKTTLEQYLTDGDRYLVCMREFEESLGEQVTQIDGHELLAKYKGMVNEMYLAGDEFNVALRRFKNRQDD